MKKAWTLAVLSLTVGLCATKVRAEGGQGGGGPCSADAEKFCSGMKPGDGKWGPCMKQHKDELSKECKDSIGGKMKGIKDKIDAKAQQACGADTDKYCSGMKPGDGKWGSCMKQNRQSLSPSCKRFMARMSRMSRGKKGQGKGSGEEGAGKNEDND